MKVPRLPTAHRPFEFADENLGTFRLSPHSPDNVLNFGAAFAIQI